MKNNNPYLHLAKQAVENWIKYHRLINLSKGLPPKMIEKKSGVFVSLHLRDGSLRGCIGTFSPTQENIAEEIIHNAIESATQDPRFPRVTKEELPDLIYSVDILSKPELVMKGFISPTLTPIPYTLDPRVHGLIVQSADGRRGLLLPDLEGVDTVNQQIEICRQKAWISEDEPVTLYRFTVERHSQT